MLDPRAWVWRLIGLAVVALAIVAALWLMGQVAGAIGGVDFATATPSPTAIATSPGPSVSPTGSGLQPSLSPAPSASGRRTPTPSKH
jgi:hypothetical protein